MQQQFLDAFRLDPETGRLFWRAPPQQHAELVGCEAGYANIGKGKNKTYWQVRLAGKTYKRSRVVFLMTHGVWPEPCVDHIDGNSLNDAPSNLRAADHAQNAWSMGLRQGKASGLPRGVSRYNDGYRAVVTLRGKRVLAKSYPTVEAADRACTAKRKEVFGDFS